MALAAVWWRGDVPERARVAGEDDAGGGEPPSDDLADTIAAAVDVAAQLVRGEFVTFRGEIGDNPAIDPAADDVDILKVTLVAGQRIFLDLLAEEISGLDGVLRVFDATGRELAAADDVVGTDPLLAFTAPRDGVYAIGVSAAANDGYDPTREGSGSGGRSLGAYELSILDRGPAEPGLVAATLKDTTGAYAQLGLDATLEIAHVAGAGAIERVAIDLGASFDDARFDEDAPVLFELGAFRGLRLDDVLASLDGPVLSLFFRPDSFVEGDRLTIVLGTEGRTPGAGVGLEVGRDDGSLASAVFEGRTSYALATVRFGPEPIELAPAA